MTKIEAGEIIMHIEYRETDVRIVIKEIQDHHLNHGEREYSGKEVDASYVPLPKQEENLQPSSFYGSTHWQIISHHVFSIEIDPEKKEIFLNKLLNRLKAKYSKIRCDENLTLSELIELANEIAKPLMVHHRAYTKGATAGLFLKLGLPYELGLEVGEYLNRKEGACIAMTSVDTANSAKEEYARELEKEVKASGGVSNQTLTLRGKSLSSFKSVDEPKTIGRVNRTNLKTDHKRGLFYTIQEPNEKDSTEASSPDCKERDPKRVRR